MANRRHNIKSLSREKTPVHAFEAGKGESRTADATLISLKGFVPVRQRVKLQRHVFRFFFTGETKKEPFSV